MAAPIPKPAGPGDHVTHDLTPSTCWGLQPGGGWQCSPAEPGARLHFRHLLRLRQPGVCSAAPITGSAGPLLRCWACLRDAGGHPFPPAGGHGAGALPYLWCWSAVFSLGSGQPQGLPHALCLGLAQHSAAASGPCWHLFLMALIPWGWDLSGGAALLQLQGILTDLCGWQSKGPRCQWQRDGRPIISTHNGIPGVSQLSTRPEHDAKRMA